MQNVQTLATAPTYADTQALIDGYTRELEARRESLLDDVAIYRLKLHDLNELDPLDFTGLGKLYRSHIAHAEALLNEFDLAGE